jgi:hypothetical protein
MGQPFDLNDIKKRLSPQLLALEGVSGIGITSGKLAVYLAADLGTLADEVRQLVASEAPEVEVELVVTGSFHKQTRPSRPGADDPA